MKYIDILEDNKVIQSIPMDNDVIERAIKVDIELHNRDNAKQRSISIREVKDKE